MTANVSKQYRCRLCLGNDNFQQDIFEKEDSGKQILLKINTCLPIKVVKGDGLPCTVCYKCLVQLDTAFELWKKSFDTEEILKYSLSDGRISSCPVNYKQENSILEELQTDQQACDSGFFQPADSEESFLDSLDDNIWKSPISQGIWPSHSNKNYPQKKPHDKSDLMSDPDSSEVDEMMQKQHCFPTAQNPIDGKNLEEKDFSEVKSRIKSQLINARISDKNVYLDLASGDAMKDERFNPRNKYLNKNLFGENLKSKDDSMMNSNEFMSDCSANQGLNDELVRRISFPWPHYNPDHHSKRKKLCDSIKGSKITNTPVTMNFGDTRSLLDLNQCPKCCKILTPSQNLLSHIRSHKD